MKNVEYMARFHRRLDRLPQPLRQRVYVRALREALWSWTFWKEVALGLVSATTLAGFVTFVFVSILAHFAGLRDQTLQRMFYIGTGVVATAAIGFWGKLMVDAIGGRMLADDTCIVCGYDLTGNQSGRCPECGTAVAPKPRV